MSLNKRYCIYLKGTEPELTFKSGEHIFPAGIGGNQKLPIEYVSHDCNNAFSKMELDFMRNSIIALPRQFEGPGKRGNLSPDNATQSKVTVMSGISQDNSVLEFGYISLGKPYCISQIKININGSCNFISDKSFGDPSKLVNTFYNNLRKFKHNYILHDDKRFSEEEFILGYHDGKWHLGLSNEELILRIDEFIKKLLEEKPLENKTPSYGTFQPRVNQTLSFDQSYFYRTCSKIVFNYLAFVKGQEFVLKDCFDPIRNWIVKDGDNHFAKLIERKGNGLFSEFPFPDKAHKLFIVKSGKDLIGFISFYGSYFETSILLCNNFDGFFDLEGFICDWQNRKEFRFLDYLDSLHQRNEGNNQ